MFLEIQDFRVGGNAALQLTLVVDLDVLLQNLRHPDPPLRLQALETLSSHAKKSDRRVIDAVRASCFCRADGNTSSLQSVALSTLAALAERGDNGIVDDVLSRLRSGVHMVHARDIEMLRSLLDAIGKLANRGDERAVATVLPFTAQPHHCSVRRAALGALVELVEVCNDEVVTALLDLLGDTGTDLHIAGEAMASLTTITKRDLGQTRLSKQDIVAKGQKVLNQRQKKWDAQAEWECACGGLQSVVAAKSVVNAIGPHVLSISVLFVALAAGCWVTLGMMGS